MNKKIKYILIIVIFLCITGFAIYQGTSAKYKFNSNNEYYLQSKGFYFESDYLSIEQVGNINTAWNGDSVHFTIKNNSNQKVITTYNINYRITCEIIGDASAYTACSVNGEDSASYEGILYINESCKNSTQDLVDVSSFNKEACTSGGYDWVNEPSIEDEYFDVELTDNSYSIEDVTVKITATSTSPYQKEITGLFILHKASATSELIMKYNNYSTYSRLNISNSSSSSKCVTLSWNSNNLIIDSENYTFSKTETDSNGYINEVSFNILSKSSVSFIYYPRTNTEYDTSSFSIIESNNC